MAFGNGTVLTTVGKASTAKRMIGGASPTQAEPKYLAIGDGATGAARTAAVGDIRLTHELTPIARSGTNAATNSANDTFQVIQTLTSPGTYTIDEAALYDNATTNNGTMFVSSTISPAVGLNNGDSIQMTVQVQYT